MYKVARAHGFISMREDAMIKAMNHEIPFEEINSLGGALLAEDPEAEEEKAQARVDNITRDIAAEAV